MLRTISLAGIAEHRNEARSRGDETFSRLVRASVGER